MEIGASLGAFGLLGDGFQDEVVCCGANPFGCLGDACLERVRQANGCGGAYAGSRW
ncbi:hypothetical protein M0D45_15350 [Xanthomonas prunicola]|nr:hypothetical protein M0D45_15350 [Xanthomonas prunicola]